MAVIDQEARAFIEQARLGHLVTVNKDGSPQLTLVRVQFADEGSDELVVAHMNYYQKLRNIERDPRVLLSFQAEPGAREYLVVHGTAEVTEGGAVELLSGGMPPPPPAVEGEPAPPPRPPMPVPENGGYITHITPSRIGGSGPWNPPPAPPTPPPSS